MAIVCTTLSGSSSPAMEGKPFDQSTVAESLDGRMQSESDPDIETLDRLENIANAYRGRGLYPYAEAIIQDIFEIRRKREGADAPALAHYHNNLGFLKAEQGKYGDAETHYLKAIALTEKHAGTDQPDFADQLNNLAGIYRSQARYRDAEKLYRRAIEIWERQSRSEHLKLALAMNNLGGLYALEGQYADAEALFERAVRIQEKSLESTVPRLPPLSVILPGFTTSKASSLKPKYCTSGF
ncbi:MAG TPA: tetratricopeptide repeat protein [Candidatus Binatia bacterium]